MRVKASAASYCAVQRGDELRAWMGVLVAGIRGSDQGASSNSVIETSLAGGSDGLLTLFFVTALLAPVFEEVVFRRFLMASLTEWCACVRALFDAGSP